MNAQLLENRYIRLKLYLDLNVNIIIGATQMRLNSEEQESPQIRSVPMLSDISILTRILSAWYFKRIVRTTFLHF